MTYNWESTVASNQFLSKSLAHLKNLFCHETSIIKNNSVKGLKALLLKAFKMLEMNNQKLKIKELIMKMTYNSNFEEVKMQLISK